MVAFYPILTNHYLFVSHVFQSLNATKYTQNMALDHKSKQEMITSLAEQLFVTAKSLNRSSIVDLIQTIQPQRMQSGKYVDWIYREEEQSNVQYPSEKHFAVKFVQKDLPFSSKEEKHLGIKFVSKTFPSFSKIYPEKLYIISYKLLAKVTTTLKKRCS